MARNWKILQEAPAYIPNGLYVSLDKRFVLTINQRVYDELEQPAAVFLMYDDETDAIGLRKTEPRTTNAHPVKRHTGTNNYRISAKPLCVKHTIRYDTTVQFLETSIEDGALAANLLKTRSAQKVRKKGKKG